VLVIIPTMVYLVCVGNSLHRMVSIEVFIPYPPFSNREDIISKNRIITHRYNVRTITSQIAYISYILLNKKYEKVLFHS